MYHFKTSFIINLENNLKLSRERNTHDLSIQSLDATRDKRGLMKHWPANVQKRSVSSIMNPSNIYIFTTLRRITGGNVTLLALREQNDGHISSFCDLDIVQSTS